MALSIHLSSPERFEASDELSQFGQESEVLMLLSSGKFH